MPSKIIFMGTPIFAKEILEHLLKMPFTKIIAVVCQPDRHQGRKKQIISSEVKKVALANNIKLLQPININTITAELAKLKPDLIITCAYGQFLKQPILSLPPQGCLNIHASLLPKLRGGAPIQWAVINNEIVTGVTLMRMALKMDSGPIFAQEKITLDTNETASSLQRRLIALTKTMLDKYLELIIKQQLQPKAQDHSQATYGLNINRTDEKINWNADAIAISCQIRGLFAQPLAYTTYNHKIYKIHDATVFDFKKKVADPGVILNFDKNGIEVQAGTGSILIRELQPESKKPMQVAAFYNGAHGLKINGKFE